MVYLSGHDFQKGQILTNRDSGAHEVEFVCKKCGETITIIDRCGEGF